MCPSTASGVSPSGLGRQWQASRAQAVGRMNLLIAVASPIISVLVMRVLRASLEIGLIGEAGNGHDALELLPRENWHLIILDLSLREGGGAHFLERVRIARPRVPVIMVSHYSYGKGIRLCLDKGAVGFVEHSALSEELVPSVRAAFAGEVYLSQPITLALKSADDAVNRVRLAPL